MRIWSIVLEVFYVLLAIGLASVGLKGFLLPNGFLDGGVTGMAILFNIFLGLDVSIGLVLLSIPFLILGFKVLSRRIFIKSTLSIILLALSIHFIEFDVFTTDKLLIAIFGGLSLGAGIGIAIKNGAVLDGSEILGVFINNKWGIKIGRVILVFNILLFSTTAIILSTEVAMYSILTYLITSEVIDYIIRGFEAFVGVMIVTEKDEAMESALLKELSTGMTIYQGVKRHGTSGTKKGGHIIHMVVNRIDIMRLYRVIDEIDPDAFVVEQDLHGIKGGAIKRYLPKNIPV